MSNKTDFVKTFHIKNIQVLRTQAILPWNKGRTFLYLHSVQKDIGGWRQQKIKGILIRNMQRL